MQTDGHTDTTEVAALLKSMRMRLKTKLQYEYKKRFWYSVTNRFYIAAFV